LLLLRRAREQQRQRAELLDREDERRRGTYAADRLDREADREQVRPDAAVLGRERQAEDVVRGEELADVRGELGRPIDLGRTRRDLLVGEEPDRVTEHELLLGQTVAGRGGLGGHRRHPSTGPQPFRGLRRLSGMHVAGVSGRTREPIAAKFAPTENRASSYPTRCPVGHHLGWRRPDPRTNAWAAAPELGASDRQSRLNSPSTPRW